MSASRFDDQLEVFLRWQASQTAGAPDAEQMASMLVVRRTRTATLGGRRPALVLAFAVTALLIATVALALVGRMRPAPIPVVLGNGPLVIQSQDCGLVTRDLDDGTTGAIAPAVHGCPRGSRGSSALVGPVYYDSVVASSDGRTVAFTRGVFCGGCGGEGSPEEHAAQGAYVLDAGGVLTRVDPDCRDTRCFIRQATISADGRLLAWVDHSYPNGLDAGLMSRLSIFDTKADRMIARSSYPGVTIQALAWSPDNRTLAAGWRCAESCREVDQGGVDLVDINDDRASTRPLASPTAGDGVGWTADGTSLIVVSELADPATGSVRIDRLAVADGQTITSKTVAADPWSAAISPDGSSVAFTVGAMDGRDGRVVLVGPDGVSRTLLDPPGDAMVTTPMWSPDGRAFITNIGSVDGRDRLVVVSLDGGEPAEVGPSPILAWLPGPP